MYTDGGDGRARVVHGLAEQRLDQRALAETALADDHQREAEAALHRLPVHLLGQCAEAQMRRAQAHCRLRVVRLCHTQRHSLGI